MSAKLPPTASISSVLKMRGLFQEGKWDTLCPGLIHLRKGLKEGWYPIRKSASTQAIAMLIKRPKYVLLILVCNQASRSVIFGTLGGHDGDDNENVKKAISWIGKTTTAHAHHAIFFTFLCRHCTTTDGKMPNFTFRGGRKQATAKFPCSFWTWICFLGIRLKKSSLAYGKVNELE